jgi:hypothetical protein
VRKYVGQSVEQGLLSGSSSSMPPAFSADLVRASITIGAPMSRLSGLKQPALAVASTALVITVALAFIALLPFSLFAGWISYFLLCVIPMQIVSAVTWGANPPFVAARPQPVKGLLLTLATLLAGVVVTVVTHQAIGGGISPPTPMVTMCAIVSVVITFWAAIIWGGWPFTAFIKNAVAAGLVMLAVCYLINYALFRVFFDYSFMQGAPVYVAAQDPHGLFPAWNALVFYLCCLVGMFFMVLFDLWPLTTAPALMSQPVLGIVWTLASLGLGAIVFSAGVIVIGMDVVDFMVQVPVPFIFGTIVVMNMRQGTVGEKFTQPTRGLVRLFWVILMGQLLSGIYRLLEPWVTGPLMSGPPSYDFEIWLASALLSVTFPLLIFKSEFFRFWPLQRERVEVRLDRD